uniref:LecA/PA-IL family lectin n=1 Tax=Halomonas sp. TaxID=1486246 RepID=UPI0026088E67|nr:LecA/PA-IL family lectin [Halomonas sp.]
MKLWSGNVSAAEENGIPSGIKVNKGDVITILANGWVKYSRGESAWAAPQGAAGRDDLPESIATLVAVINNKKYSVGNYLYRWDVPESGEISFLFNDRPGTFSDNSGEFHVEVYAESSQSNVETWDGTLPGNSESGVKTNLVVKKGDIITVKASGTIHISQEGKGLGPNGSMRGSSKNAIFPPAQLASVVMKIADTYYPAGEELTDFVAPEDGEVSFIVNDQPGSHVDNRGEFSIHMDVTRAE